MRNPILPWISAVVWLMLMAMPAHAATFTASFSWAGIPACEKISPAFQLTGVPAGTKRLRFEMHDLEVPTFHHGGSTVAHDGADVKRGAIKYIGPCPPGGQRHRYRWTIHALDAAGKVLDTTTATQTFPP